MFSKLNIGAYSYLISFLAVYIHQKPFSTLSSTEREQILLHSK